MSKQNAKRFLQSFSVILLTLILIGCTSQKTKSSQDEIKPNEDFANFSDEVAFMNKYTDIIELSEPSGKGRIAVSPSLQGRVMTSSSSGLSGRSYGWINRDLFKSGDTLEHINVYGGEERFWLGPEGGQYSIFFQKGSEFNLDNWYTPRLIDLEEFYVKEQSNNSAIFTKEASLTNYSGFEFNLNIERKVEVLSRSNIFNELSIEVLKDVNMVAYKTTNSLTNVGSKDWKKETGLLSIWILGIYHPSPATTVVIPFKEGPKEELGAPVNDTYFGKVPADRLLVKDDVLFFSGDGTFRSKIGLSPSRAKNILGSYDSTNKILTIVKYKQPEGVTDYVNSMWEIQEEPYAGDVINSYNDGPPSPGAEPLGPFYELETSSPALALKSGETGIHIQLTCHFEGDKKSLDNMSMKLLGVSLSEIEAVQKNNTN